MVKLCRLGLLGPLLYLIVVTLLLVVVLVFTPPKTSVFNLGHINVSGQGNKTLNVGVLGYCLITPPKNTTCQATTGGTNLVEYALDKMTKKGIFWLNIISILLAVATAFSIPCMPESGVINYVPMFAAVFGGFCAMVEFIFVAANIGVKNVGKGSVLVLVGAGLLLIYGAGIFFMRILPGEEARLERLAAQSQKAGGA